MRYRVVDRHRQFARAMRADATVPEALLWQQLRGKRVKGLRFRRQVPLDGYILDFVCFEARLIIEVDGWQHAGSARDIVRDLHFQTVGFTVLRFWNEEILDAMDFVYQKIIEHLHER